MRAFPLLPAAALLSLAWVACPTAALAASAQATAQAAPTQAAPAPAAPQAPSAAQDAAAAAPARAAGERAPAQGDPLVRAQLEALGYKYRVDEDGDFILTFGLPDDRSQLAYVMSRTQQYGSLHVREIWSPGYRAAEAGGEFPAAVANRLLADTQLSKLGGWAKQDGVAVFVVKIDASAGGDVLDDAIDYAVRAADQMEAQLTPGKDEF